MRLLPLFLAIAGCTQVTRESVLEPPTPQDLEGSYSARWRASAGDLLASAVIVLPDQIVFAAEPCASDPIGGTFLYDQSAGDLEAELKSLDGSVRLFIEGRFVGLRMSGAWEVRVVGELCDRGTMTMEHQ